MGVAASILLEMRYADPSTTSVFCLLLLTFLYVKWLSEECYFCCLRWFRLEPEKYQGKKIERRGGRKIKNRFKLNKLIMYVLFKLIFFGEELQ